MAKKATAETVEVAPQETAVKTAPVQKAPSTPVFEFKDRTYYIATGKSPLVYTIPSRHSQRKPLLYFDKDLGYARELRYATNQRTPLVDEQKGEVTLGRIVFRNGTLTVRKEDVALQKLLSIYHPFKDRIIKN
jgi:hypothetical protein